MTDRSLEDLGSELTLYAARLIRWLRKEQQQPVGMRLLSILDEHGPQGVTALAGIDQCSQPTMSGTVQALVERGWVRKDADPSDARASVVSLTDEGVAVLAQTRRANGAIVVGRLGTHSAQDLAAAVALLRDLLPPPKGQL
ncbi:MAG TPA: MarR family transcriptional regulator [Marmoricola sp.]|nr:MarR family transcriptional regulator [Marmoricola sp.]